MCAAIGTNRVIVCAMLGFDLVYRPHSWVELLVAYLLWKLTYCLLVP